MKLLLIVLMMAVVIVMRLAGIWHQAGCCCKKKVTCDCQGLSNFVATVTTTGSCDESSPGCDYDCAGDVFFMTWVGDSWIGASSMPGPSTGWFLTVRCVDDVWTTTLEGGCGDLSGENDAKWESVEFEPEDCVTVGSIGHPIHSGVNMGNPTTSGGCWIDCVPTVALSAS